MVMKTLSHKLKSIFVFLLAISVYELTFAQPKCTLKKDKDNIKVYSCPAENSAFKTVRAEFELDATIDEYIAIALDVEGYKTWHYHVMSPRLLERVSDSEIIYYTQISAPWPISNRDVIMHLKLDHNLSSNTLTVTLKSLDNYLPIVKGFVRVAQSNTVLTLTPIANARLKVNYSIHADPGGKLPPWAVDLVSTQGPYETFKNLQERIKLLRKNSVLASLKLK